MGFGLRDQGGRWKWIGLLLALSLGCSAGDDAAYSPDPEEQFAAEESLDQDMAEAVGDQPEGDGQWPAELAESRDVESASPEFAPLTLNPPESVDPEAVVAERDGGGGRSWQPPEVERDEAPRSAMSPRAARSSQLPNIRTSESPVSDEATAAIDAPAAAVDHSEESVAEEPLAAETGDVESIPRDLVTVFYATNRARLHDVETASPLTALALVAAVVALFIIVALALKAFRASARVRLAGLLVGGVVAGTVAMTVRWESPAAEPAEGVSDTRVHYGNQRGDLELGTCAVSIPWSHQVGQVERPSLLRLEVREDVRQHVVLQDVESCPDERFFSQLRDRVTASSREEVFVFVHGYNVTFDQAARRTAQIAFDVKFQGAPIFFSWPSQGGLLKYTVDETNVTWAVPHLKQFLLDVVQRSGARSVNLIAHSMGNRALTNAVRELKMELREESALFNQIILAAPDVDAEIFRRDLAPALVQSARRVTLYASSNDQALIASKKVHGYARAGDTGDGLVVVQGLDTIDVSTIATSLLGHSYYGSSNPVLLDICELIHDARPAAQRRWLVPRPHGNLTYWVLEKIKETANRLP
jgi:esterase/lipase superfamily enzyme